jgi:tetratricopeptide (TPR) repeat protein
MKLTQLFQPMGLSAVLLVGACAAIQTAQDVQLGRNALRANQPAAAVGYLREAAELDPSYRIHYALPGSVLAYLGRAYYEAGNYADARRVLERALSLEKNDDLARLYLGLVLARAGDQPSGRREIESGLKGIYDDLESLAATPYRGLYWDPTKQIRSEIQRALTGKVEPAELIRIAQWTGASLDEEIDNARRDEIRDRYLRVGGD